VFAVNYLVSTLFCSEAAAEVNQSYHSVFAVQRHSWPTHLWTIFNRPCAT